MRKDFLLVLSLCALLCAVPEAQAQGIFVSGVGAVNRSMGSAAVAAPLDAAGAIFYNPATMSAFDASQVEMSLELLRARTKVSSRIDAYGLEGSTDDDSSTNPMPAFALVRRDLGDLTFGIGFASVAGFRSDYPVDPTNPILSPQPPAGIGLGRVLGSADIFQLTPAVSYQVTERWSFGFAPILTIAKIEVNPLVFASPAATGAYPTGTDPDYRYGGGFQLGAYHEGESGFNYGFAFKSPQWIETFNVNATDASGAPREESYQMDLPMIASIGASYTGLQDWLFALDVRYTDYSSVNGFAESGYNAQGAVKGLGWDSIFSVSPGIQYMPTEKLALRIGYTYMENPIPDSQAMFNVASPLMYQHILGVGMSYELGCDTTFSVAYLHGFENSVSGPIVNPVLGDLPGTEVENESSADAIAVALTFEY